MANVLIQGDYVTGIGINTYVDGCEIHDITDIKMDISICKPNKFTFQLNSIPDIDVTGRCDFGFTVETIQQACKVLKHILDTDDDYYNGLVASIESALRESAVVWEEEEYTETARKIADRIIGKE